MDKGQLWTEVLNEISQRISKASYDTWLKNLKVIEMTNDNLIIETGNEFQKDWLESQYIHQLEEIIRERTGEKKELIFVAEERKHTTTATITDNPTEYVQISDLLKKIEELESRISDLEKKDSLE